jgi:V/A-type H+-transporting ATPase subunit D
MAAAGYFVSATPGTLVNLRKQLKLIQKGKDILEMKRDRLMAEVNRLLQALHLKMEEGEKLLTDAYDHLKIAYSKLGYSGLASAASSVGMLDFRTSVRSDMGVAVPVIADLRSESETGFTDILEPTAQQASEKLRLYIEKLLEITEMEASVERIATELMMTNRRVNALQNTAIPNITRLIADIEDKLEEEDLEESFKAKKMKSTVWGER